MKPYKILRYLLIGTLTFNIMFSSAIADVKFKGDKRSQGSFVGSGAVNALQIGNLIDLPPDTFKKGGESFFWYAPSYYQQNPAVPTSKRFDGDFISRKFKNSTFETINDSPTDVLWQAKNKLQNRTKPRLIITGDGILKPFGVAANRSYIFTAAANPGRITQLHRNEISLSAPRVNAIISYMHGNTPNPPGGFTARTSKLGQVINSNMLYYKHSDGRQIVYFGADDGMLHAINANTGEEEFAYMPSAVLPHLNMLVTEPGYDISKRPVHTVDGKIAIYTAKDSSGKPRTILVGTLGKGLKGLYALDITGRGAAPYVLWEYFSDPRIGHIEGMVEITRAKVKDGAKHMVFIGNGLGSSSNSSTLLGIDLFNGDLELSFDVPAGGEESPARGLYAPTLTDHDLRGTVDIAYAADSSGKVVRFKLEEPAGKSNRVQVIYKTKNPNQQVLVSSKPAVMRHPKGGSVISLVTSRQANGSVPEVVGFWSKGLEDAVEEPVNQDFTTVGAYFKSDGDAGRALEGNPNKIRVNWNNQNVWRIFLEPGEEIRHQDAFQFNGRLYFSSRKSNGAYHLNRIGIMDPTWSACGDIIYAAEGNGTFKQCNVDQHFVSELYEQRLLVQPNIILLNHTAFRPRKVEEVWREDFRR